MLRTTILLLSLLVSLLFNAQATAQALSLKSYVNQHAQPYEEEAFASGFTDPSLFGYQAVFFGFIHGSASPQVADYVLLEYLVAQGTRYYIPEVDYSMAYFLNRYLATADEKLLELITYHYANKVPQDASIQWQEKWRKIAALQQQLPDSKKIIVLGTDAPSYDRRLALSHLAYLAPASPTGNPWVDSLRNYRNYQFEDLSIWSGKPVYELAVATGQTTLDFVYALDSRYHFAKRFFAYASQHVEEVAKVFGANHEEARKVLMADLDMERELHLFRQFDQQALPLIEAGEKVYANFGYSHIHQAPVGGYDYLAARIKQAHPDLKLASIVGLLAHSKALKERVFKKNGEEIRERGVVFEAAACTGYKPSSTWDGHSLWERPMGIETITRRAGRMPYLWLDLTQDRSPFRDKPYLARYSRGEKTWPVDPNCVATDHYQYLLLMQFSASEIPYELGDKYQ